MGSRRAGSVAGGLGLVVFVGLFTGVATAAPHQRAVIRLDDADNGRNINSRPGDEIIVSIRNCFSCRYRWEVSQAPDAQIVASRSEEDRRAPAGSPDGAPEFRQFTFEAVAEGATAVTLSYYPPASPSGGGRPESTYRLSLTVLRPDEAVSPSGPAVRAAGAPPSVPTPPAPAPAPVPAVTAPSAPAAAPVAEPTVLGPALPAESEVLGPPVPIVPPRLAGVHEVSRSGPAGNRGILLLGAAIVVGGLALLADGLLGVKRPAARSGAASGG